MKISSLFFALFFIAGSLYAQITPLQDSVEAVPGFKNLFHYQNYYISGQPAYELLQWLQNRDVHVIINLRSEKENSDFTAGAFNESRICTEMGFQYYSVPVDGLKDYTPARLDTLSALLSTNDPIFLHCASGGRATDFFMAYLVKSKGYTVNQAAEIGRNLKFTLPLEKLLDSKIYLEEHP